MSIPSYPFHSFILKLSDKRRKKYSKIILFFNFHCIPFPLPNKAFKKSGVGKNFYGHIDTHSKLKSDDVYNRKYKYKNTVGNL